MRQFLALLLIVGAIWGGKQLYNYWEIVKAKKETDDRGGAPPPASAPAASAVLPGLPANLEAPLQAAQKQRTPTNSPIYPRVKQLERTYQ